MRVPVCFETGGETGWQESGKKDTGALDRESIDLFFILQVKRGVRGIGAEKAFHDEDHEK